MDPRGKHPFTARIAGPGNVDSGIVLECGSTDCDLSSIIEKIKGDITCVVLLNEDEMQVRYYLSYILQSLLLYRILVRTTLILLK